MTRIKKAVIPSAGLGTRFLPATKAMPKEMLPILDKPTIQYIVEEAVDAGIEDIIIVTGKHKRALEDHFDHQMELENTLKRKGKFDLLDKVNHATNLANIFYVRQKQPKGLGHAILSARQFIGDEPFAVLLGDDIVESDVPAIKQLVDVYYKNPSTVLGVKEVSDEDVSKYGVIEYDDLDKNIFNVNNMIEKPHADETDSRMGIIGRYILTSEIFQELEKGIIGFGGEIQLTDAIKNVSAINLVQAIRVEGKRHDVGDKKGFVLTNLEYAMKSELRDDNIEYIKNIS